MGYGVNYTMQIWIDVVQWIACSTTEIEIWVQAMAWAFCCTRGEDFLVFISPLRWIMATVKIFYHKVKWATSHLVPNLVIKLHFEIVKRVTTIFVTFLLICNGIVWFYFYVLCVWNFVLDLNCLIFHYCSYSGRMSCPSSQPTHISTNTRCENETHRGAFAGRFVFCSSDLLIRVRRAKTRGIIE